MANFGLLPSAFNFDDLSSVLNKTVLTEAFVQLVIDHDPKILAAHFEKIDYGNLKKNVEMFAGMAISTDDECRRRHATESPLVAQVVNYLEGKFPNRSATTNVVIETYAWLTFSLERTLSRLRKVGGPSGDGALEELQKRRNSGCSQPVEHDFAKSVREQVDNAARLWQGKMAEMGDIEELRKKNELLEEKKALLEKRIATLEQENRASAEMKVKFMQKIKEFNKKEEEMTERVKVLEEEKAAWDEAAEEWWKEVSPLEERMVLLKKNTEENRELSEQTKKELLKVEKANDILVKEVEESHALFEPLEKHLLQLKEKVMEFNEKHKKSLGLLGEENKKQAETIAHLQKNAREIQLETDFVNIKNTVLERKLKENEAESEMMKRHREDMHRLLDQRNQALEDCHREKMKMIEDFHLDVRLIDKLQVFSEKFDSLEPKDYRTELFASLGKLKPDICDFDSPEWIELESQLLVPFLMGKELAKKKKAEGEDLYNQIGDHLARLGLHIDP